MDFHNKTVVVTGAGGGVGRELVLQLLNKGAAVAAIDINEEALEKTGEQASPSLGELSLHVVDITDRARVSRLSGEVKQIHGGIHGLINNAGVIQPFTTLCELDPDIAARVMKTNYNGMMNMTRAFVPFLAEPAEARIGNVSSMGGFLPVPGQSVYGASKAAVKIATEGLRMELSQTGIGVSLILPGGIETDIKKNSGLETEGASESDKKSAGLKLTSPQEAARIILAGMEKNRARIFIGTDARVMDLLYRLMPVRAGNMISKIMAANHGGILNTSVGLLEFRGAR